MIQLDPTESRVLGVLVEKAHTSGNYPLSLNAATDGCNQKSNRHPIVNYDEDRVLQALDRLRAKGLAIFADALGSRVTKFRHNAREALGVDDAELVILAELLLRGPQTASELRSRASRMQPLDSHEVVQSALQRLMDRPEPMVKRIPTPRADRFAQLLCPGLHPAEEAGQVPGEEGAFAPSGAAGAPAASAPEADRLDRLEAQVRDLRQIVERLAAALGATDILTDPSGAPEQGARGPSQ
jgi:uncharacterized protein YceH (UPF0502 family)